MTPNGGVFLPYPDHAHIESFDVGGWTATQRNGDWLIAGVHDQTEVFKTVNNGFSWIAVKTG